MGILFLLFGIFGYLFVGSQVAETIGEGQSERGSPEEPSDSAKRRVEKSSIESEERPQRNQSEVPQQEAKSAEGEEGGPEGEDYAVLEPPEEVASRAEVPAKVGDVPLGAPRRKVYGAPSRDYEEKMIKALVKEAYMKVTGEGGDEELQQAPAYTLKVEPSSRNVTPADSQLVFFSAVPKCGSSTTGHLFKKLSVLNNYYSLTPQQRIQPVIDEEQQKTLLENLFSLSEKVPVAYTRHLYYFNTTRLGFPRAAWVAIVRHPVERLISQFYYARIPSRYLENKLLQGRMPSAEFMNMTLDTCVPQRDPRCWYREGSRQMLQLSFFCARTPTARPWAAGGRCKWPSTMRRTSTAQSESWRISISPTGSSRSTCRVSSLAPPSAILGTALTPPPSLRRHRKGPFQQPGEQAVCQELDPPHDGELPEGGPRPLPLPEAETPPSGPSS
ncbi:Heparan sulfate 2-O-sulfotransferase [Penaeus vannamei]|uniref:Heparan sulfate 2-O-sulfotransferase n=1 Tax=Penaeus vannamei TaxID=6689 RepID=A0A423T4Q7_PENVA|nr:Heparan sulfate 2-O-sulfotransferase [Penaeus vannamei]